MNPNDAVDFALQRIHDSIVDLQKDTRANAELIRTLVAARFAINALRVLGPCFEEDGEIPMPAAPPKQRVLFGPPDDAEIGVVVNAALPDNVVILHSHPKAK